MQRTLIAIICLRVEIFSLVLQTQQEPHWVSSSFASIIFVASWHTLFLGNKAKRCCGSWYIHSCLPFVNEDGEFAKTFGTLPKRHATSHRSQPIIQRSKFLQFNINLFAISFKLGFSSGIIELIDAQFYGRFHLCTVKTFRLKTLLCSVRGDPSVDKRKTTC